MTGRGEVVMTENHEIVEVGNTNRSYNGTASLADPTSVDWSAKFGAWLKLLFRSRRNRAASLPEATEVLAVPSTSVYSSTRIERLSQQRSEFETDVEFEIESSRLHWSELESTSVVQQAGRGEAAMAADESSVLEDEGSHMTNAEIVRSLKRQWPKNANFFGDLGVGLKVRAKIAEGAQAEIFEATSINGHNLCVLKVFKEGSSLQDLQRQSPLITLKQSEEHGFYMCTYASSIVYGVVVMNGRFAILMSRCWGDLRKLIDLRMQSNLNQRPPFSDHELESNMWLIAREMMGLHKDKIIHKDLKASNVLIRPLCSENSHKNTEWVFSSDIYSCKVADYECSVGVLGTGFWRAPEILQGVKDRNITPDLFTEASDVYSFAMTCYEMITGRLPFEDERSNNYDVVLSGERPILPDGIEAWIKALVNRCWHPNPRNRPSFEEIVKFLELNSDWRYFEML